MKFHFDVLSKKAREEWVTVMVNELDEDSDIVRVKFRELPEAEFSQFEMEFTGAVGAVGRLAKEVSRLEQKLHEERLSSGVGQSETMAALRKAIAGCKEASAELQAVRRSMVSKVVIDHDAEYFEVDHLPMENDDIAGPAKEALSQLGFTVEQIAEGLRTGFIRVPFIAGSWTYGEGLHAEQRPGASDETVRQYERLRPNSQLLNSLCNAVLYWHRLALKPAQQRKEEMRGARQARHKMIERAQVLVKHKLLRPENVAKLVTLDTPTFLFVISLITDTFELQNKETMELLDKIESLPSQNPIRLEIPPNPQ